MEQIHDGRGQECRAEVDTQPERPARRALEDRREHVVFLVEAGGAHEGVFRLVADHVHDVVHGDPAHDAIVVVHHRRGQQVTVLEFPDDLRGRRVRRNRHDFGGHDAGYEVFGIVDQKPRQKQGADILVVAIDDKYQVGAVGQLAVCAQITRDNLERDVRPDRDDVHVHQAAGAVFVVGQYLLQAFVIQGIQRLQYLLGHGFRQVGEQVGEVVELHAFGGGDELLGLHALDQPVAHFVDNFDEHVAFVLGVYHLPQQGPFPERHRFEQAGDFGGMQAVDHQPGGAHAAAVEPLAQQLQVGLGVLSRFHGCGPGGWRRESSAARGTRSLTVFVVARTAERHRRFYGRRLDLSTGPWVCGLLKAISTPLCGSGF